MEVIKVDENTIKIIKNIITTQVNNYSYGDLIKQRETIEAQKKAEIIQRDTEIAEVSALITECEKLGMTSVKQ